MGDLFLCSQRGEMREEPEPGPPMMRYLRETAWQYGGRLLEAPRDRGFYTDRLITE